MKSEWRTVALGSVADLTVGFVGTMASNYTETGIPFLRSTNIEPFDIKLDDIKYISSNFNESLRKSELHPNDVVIVRTGTPGACAVIPAGVKAWNCSDLVIVRPHRNKLNPLFLASYVNLASGVINTQLVGAVQQHYNVGAAKKMQIPLPPIGEQDKIASIIGMLNKKITINSKINDNLEQQAATLFSSLYNRSNTEVRYTDLIQILGGGTPKTGETAYWNGNIAFFTPKDVGTPYTFITEKTITEEGLSHCNSRLYPVNTVFVTARGTVGKVGLSGVPMAMNQSCYALVGKETHQLLVYFYTLKAVDRLKHKASGAVFDAITTRDFDSEQIMKLSDDNAKAFLYVAEPMFQEILNNSIENLQLSTLRDFLLPKLMSGEIDVSSVQL
ncbi:hypothetical protein GPK62_11960 [Faecalibacterium prausnitzii]|uniref:restriction endonuclease subunit S n=1 Tax=Faecalibacterium prausnitzii TaxID=853 RepID=UPI001C00D8EC|nr:restriction endonuclease subunit S [Faecalibacterium prausnitzii]MBT9708049.1 hypothetical protein [Faecalibacterium prausnitzii]